MAPAIAKNTRSQETMKEFLKKFKVILQERDPMIELLSFKHTSTIGKFYDQFTFLLVNVSLFESYAINLFLNKLKNAKQKHVIIFKPTTLQQTFVMAQLQEFTLKKLHKESTITF